MLSIEGLVKSAKKVLSDHTNANAPSYDGRWIHFFVELAIPIDDLSTVCRHPLCGEETSSYRISVHPGRISAEGSSNSCPDYYHIKCFEELINLNNPSNINRFEPLTPRMCNISTAHEGSILDWGAYRLVQEWKLNLQRAARPERHISLWLDQERQDLWYNGGSASYKIPKNTIDPPLYSSLSTMAAAVESDGPYDQDEWNLFNNYLPSSLGVLPAPSSLPKLSEVLKNWNRDKTIVTLPHGRTKEQTAYLRRFSPKARRGITRLSAIPGLDAR